ncbi:MAG: T9SS type A sorting domain-containing protein [Bacteroidales bacterium]|nr:T9SS type A sorting domain-containing protein [Bacteroidales bacterium]
MRSLTFSLILSLFSICSYAQWQINGSDIYYNEGNVGIGLTNPDYKLEIESLEDFTTYHRTFIRLINKSVSQNSCVNMRLYAGENGSFTSLSHLSETYTASPNQADFGQLWTSGAGLLLRAQGGIIRLETSVSGATMERMRIDSIGNIGIGTSEPKARVHVANGDIYISEISRGIIMKSPDGQCWRGTVNNDGQLIFEPVDCPELTNSVNESQTTKTKDISVFPNPSENYISVKFDEKEFKKLRYIIHDVNGRLILKGIVRLTNKKINISHLMNGIYFLSINDKNGNKLTSEKIIKK